MAMDDVIPDAEHVSRYCGGAAIHEDGRIDGSAFALRANEQYLSVNWLESLGVASRDAQIREIRSVLARKLTLGSTASIAVLNIGQTQQSIDAGLPEARNLTFLHKPRDRDLSHSGILGLGRSVEDDLIADLIAEIAIKDQYPAKP